MSLYWLHGIFDHIQQIGCKIWLDECIVSFRVKFEINSVAPMKLFDIVNWKIDMWHPIRIIISIGWGQFYCHPGLLACPFRIWKTAHGESCDVNKA